MALYKATLYALNHEIPYFNTHRFTLNKNKLQYPQNIKIGWNQKIQISKVEEVDSPIFLKVGELVLYRQFFKKYEDAESGIVFPELRIKHKSRKIHYIMQKTNQRLYVHIERELNDTERKIFYQNSLKIPYREKYMRILALIEKEEQYREDSSSLIRQKRMRQKINRFINYLLTK